MPVACSAGCCWQRLCVCADKDTQQAFCMFEDVVNVVGEAETSIRGKSFQSFLIKQTWNNVLRVVHSNCLCLEITITHGCEPIRRRRSSLTNLNLKSRTRMTHWCRHGAEIWQRVVVTSLVRAWDNFSTLVETQICHICDTFYRRLIFSNSVAADFYSSGWAFLLRYRFTCQIV